MLRSRKKVLLDELRHLNVIALRRSLSNHEKLRKADITSDIERTTLVEEVSWRQNRGFFG